MELRCGNDFSIMVDLVGKKIRFIGCGGAGMVGLAKIAFELGAEVSGSDARPDSNTALLESLGISVDIGDTVSNLGEYDLVVRSSAISDEHPEFASLADSGVPNMLRGEFLAEIAGLYDTVVAVAGSHGKTSVTAALTHILRSSDMAPGFMIGGKVRGWDAPASAGADRSLFVTESDESDGTQRFLSPDILLLTNVEDDHSWSAGGTERLFATFAELAAKARTVVASDSESTHSVLAGHPSVRYVDTSLEKRDFRAFNAALAARGAAALGLDEDAAFAIADSFPGVERRMSIRFDSPDLLLVEDYAHHPTEVRSALSVIRSLRPGNKLRVVFQPHRYARLAKYLDDFARGLRDGADEVLITPVFAAWSETGDLDSADLASAIGPKASTCSSDWSAVASAILAERNDAPETVAVLGAGDVDGLVGELRSRLQD